MSIAYEFTQDQQREWDEWVANLPEVSGKLARAFPINRLHTLLSSGHLVTPYSYNDNGTLSVIISREHNDISEGRRVFGIFADDLVEWRDVSEN